jgi:hypothetical protein
MEAIEIFTSVVHGQNWFTPVVIDYIKIKHGAVELSRGNSVGSEFFNTNTYGVTVVIGGEQRTDKNELFRSKQESLEYIESLK